MRTHPGCLLHHKGAALYDRDHQQHAICLNAAVRRKDEIMMVCVGAHGRKG
ncbi:MAG: hypothetical protein MUO64_10470 [Anaerolineales bacterium]|nr:hypothetical protein [Anaerolineales bacterium]